jgi:hypothetical protein
LVGVYSDHGLADITDVGKGQKGGATLSNNVTSTILVHHKNQSCMIMSININVERDGFPSAKLRWAPEASDSSVESLVCGAGKWTF